MKKLLSIAFLLALSSNAFADYAWYYGTIKRVWPLNDDGGFVITFEGTSSLSDCRNQYAVFSASLLPPEKLDKSFSLALSAFHAGSTVGVELDKDLYDDQCLPNSITITK
ncbi:hypothetical protein [Microbulbifer sp. TYP-18]|uniref:hypothetical protein n=1 Tax=Microbulbifer sp. TYP-18 TaxID=3230024 RepID=UPI0034C6A191